MTENPLYTYFDVDERTYLALAGAATRQSSWFSGLHFPVQMRLAGEPEFTHTGTVNFLDLVTVAQHSSATASPCGKPGIR